MPLPVISNTVRVALEGLCSSGQPWVNVLHFRKTSGAIDAAAITALNTELIKLYGGASYGGGGVNMLNNCNSSTLGIEATYTPLDGVAASTVLPFSVAGSGATQALPGETCPLITLRTGNRGPRYRGRIFLPHMHEGSNSTAGGVDGPVVTAYNAQLAGFLAALPAINWQWVVASYTGSFATTVVGATLRSVFMAQRRRRS